MPDDDALGRTLMMIADEVGSADADRVVSRAADSNRLARRQRLWLGGVAAVVGTVMASNVSGVLAPASAPSASSHADSSNSTVDQPGPDFITVPLGPGEPCPGAERHTLKQLADLADVPVWLPDAPAASIANITGAWTCGGDTPILTFGPVQISYESGYGNVAIPQWCRDFSEQWQVDGQLELLLGYPGCLLLSTGPGILTEIMVVLDDGILIRVLADRSVPADDLVAVVNSIDLASPVEG